MKKKKIIMLCDHPMSTSGVGTQSRWLIEGLVATGKYSFRVFGGAMKHQDHNVIKVSDDFIIKPTEGFGTKELLRMVIATEQPDALMLFTDPRFFIWTWEMEDEIHQVCPIVYWHLWDNDPWPEFNRVLYESTDLINCINWKTYAMVKEHFPEKTNYIPHSLPPQIYHQLSDEQAKQSRQNLFGKDAEDKFIGIWVNRNARRKMPGDVLAAWALFVKELKEKHGKNDCMLVMHTDPFDHEGANLHEVVKVLGIQKNVVFSTDRVPFEQMNMLYNAVDFCVNISANEGFGLSTLEAMLTGKPIIALKTGGLTQQVVNDDNSENGIALEPEVRNLVGSQLVPYIYEDHVSNETVASAFMKLYEAGPEGRKALGQRAKEYSTKKYNHKKTINDWDCSLMNTIDNWKKSYKPWKMITL